MSALLLVAGLCLAAGALLGLLGGGGSILAVPVLVYAGGLEPRAAIATSLLVVGASSALAAGAHGLRGAVDVRAGLTLGLASMAGAYAGGRIGQRLPEALLLGAFTVVMGVTALAMIRRRPDVHAAPHRPGGIRVIAIGLAIGALTGVVGAGGGFVLVPALVLACGLPIRRAIGTSLLVIAMNSMAGFAGAAATTPIDPWLAGLASAAAALGSLAGVVASARVPAEALRAGFGWFVMAMTAFMTLKQLPAPVVEGMRAAASHIVTALGGAGVVALVWLLVHLRRHTGGGAPPAATRGRT